MKSKFWIFPIIIIAILAFFLLIKNKQSFSPNKNSTANTALDTFAQCLAQKKITMYGADWCTHCQNQKKAFGSSFQYVPYVECPKETKTCLDKNVKGYPTWIFPDGKRLEGEQDLSTLSEQSGCKLPN